MQGCHAFARVVGVSRLRPPIGHLTCNLKRVATNEVIRDGVKTRGTGFPYLGPPQSGLSCATTLGQYARSPISRFPMRSPDCSSQPF
jgi:hypothetical protein